MTKKERLMAIFMLFAFVLAVAALIVGTLNNNEPLVLSGFGVLIAVFLYSLYAKKRLDSVIYEEQAEKESVEQAKDASETSGASIEQNQPTTEERHEQ